MTYSSVKRSIGEPLLKKIINALPQPVFVKDAQSVFVLSNKKHEELTGIKEAELVGHTSSIMFGTEGGEASRLRDIPVLESGEVQVVMRDYVFADGQTSYLETKKIRLQDEDGSFYILGTHIDHTATRQKSENLNLLIEAVPVGIVQVQESKGVVFCNAIAEQLLQTSDKDNGEALSLLTNKLGTSFPGEKRRYDCKLPGLSAGDLGMGIVESSGWISLPHQRDRVAIVSLVDISETDRLRRSNELITNLNAELTDKVDELGRMQAELVRTGKLEQLGQLTATVAHELRNPLGAVRTSAFLLERKLKGQHPELNPQFERISNGIKRCDDIITQLLDFARTQPLKLEPHDLDDWLSKLLTELASQYPAMLVINFSQGLDGRYVNFDPERMRRAIVNTIQNAVEAMSLELSATATESRPHIAISTREIDDKVWVDIADIGPGMSEDILAKIREPLFTTKNFGTGLGVPAVEKILQQHGGGLNIVSQPGQGTTVTLWWLVGKRTV